MRLLSVGLAFAAIISAASADVCDNCLCSSPGPNTFEIDCSNLGLTTVPADVPTNTTVLRLANNFIAYLGGQPFATLSHLETLVLSQNNIATLGAGVLTGLSSLKYLYMSDVNLETIDDSALDSVADTLQVLVLSNNRLLGNLSSNVFDSNFQSLTYLSLQRTGLDVLLPATFSGLSALQRLDLSQNYLQSAHLIQALVGLNNLTELRLSRNNLNYLNRHMLAGAPALASLYVDQNPMDGSLFDIDTFSGTVDLQTLWMDTEEVLSLGLDTLPESLFSYINPTVIKLGGNNWDCCSLPWLLGETAVADLAAVTCDRPQLAHGLSLSAAVAAGVLGNDSCSQDVPNAPNAPTVIGVGERWAMVQWTPVHGNAYEVSHYEVSYAKASSCSSQSTLLDCSWFVAQCTTGRQPAQPAFFSSALANCQISGPLSNGNTIDFNVTSIHPFSDYWIRVVAYNKLGGSVWNGTVAGAAQATTLDSVPGPPANLVADARAEFIVFNWQVPVMQNGLIINYIVSYANSSGIVRTASTNSGSSLSINITGLSANTLYSLTVTAETRSGLGDPSSMLSVRTAEKPPDPPVDQPVIITVGPMSATVSWDPLPYARQHGSIIATRLVNADTGGVLYEGQETEALISGLIPATLYSVRVSFANNAGIGNMGPMKTFTTLNAEPGPPDLPSGVALDNETIMISWSEPSVTNGDIVQYDIELRDEESNETTRSTHSGDLVVGATTFTATKRNLKSSVVYRFRVRAFTSVYNELRAGNWSAWGSTITLEGISSPVPVRAESLSANSTRISFEYPSPANGIITRYFIYQINKSQEIPLFLPTPRVNESTILIHTIVPDSNATEGDSYTFVHMGLDAYTNYTYSVTAITSVGASQLGVLRSTALTDIGAPTIQAAPSVRTIGHSEVEVSWPPPQNPNGAITEFQVWKDRELVYQGVPEVSSTGLFTVIITGLDDGELFEFSVTSATAGGQSARSSVATAETTSSNPDVTATVVITLLSILIVVLTLGMVRERSVDSMAALNSSRIHGHFFRRDKDGNISGGFGRDDDESSESGSEYGDDEVRRPSLERVAHLRKSLTPEPADVTGEDTEEFDNPGVLVPVRGRIVLNPQPPRQLEPLPIVPNLPEPRVPEVAEAPTTETAGQPKPEHDPVAAPARQGTDFINEL